MPFPTPTPLIPAGLLHDIIDVRPGDGYYDMNNGGQWVQGAATEATFSGIILPIDNEDLQYNPAGTFTVNSQKLYTNGHSLRPGQTVRDTLDGTTYTVKQELRHTPLHPMKRYVVETAGEASAK
ncbi:MAG: hypothetical protein LBJ11_09095 [Oscillospiraceae bacterium]|jgi:hypothetical protein|nr:hypothetical protein [Oscillospiraceae bacterium]